MKKFFQISMLLIVLLPIGAIAQTFVSGMVVDETKNGLPGVSVTNKTRGKGVVTDVNGEYKIVVKQNDVLVFSFIGYANQMVIFKEQSKINIQLQSATNDLDEVTVIGYGTVKKRDLTGSVASITEKQISNRVNVSVEQMLQGMVSGVQVTETSSEPGGESSIRIRGNNSINSSNEPLYVIDGFIGGDITGLSPSDIQSIEVLKDASSTAIYGSRGANGVILVTTKKGNEGAPKIELNTKFGFSHVSKIIDMMNAQQYATFINEGKSTPLFSDQQIADMGVGTNWQDEIFQTGMYQNYQISLKGGTKQSKYFVSGGYLSQKGNVINSYLDKINFRANFSTKLNKIITFDLNTNFSSSTGNRATVNTAGAPQDGATVLNSLRMAPFVNVRDANGNYTLLNDFPGNMSPVDGSYAIRLIGNPVAYANEVVNNLKNVNGTLNGQLTVEFTPGFTLKSTVGQSLFKTTSNGYIPRSIYEGSFAGGKGSMSLLNKSNFLTEHTLLYKPQIGNGQKFDIMGGFTFQNYGSDNFSITALNYFSDANKGLDISNASTVSDYSSSLISTSIMSYLLRANYSLNDRYLATFSGRADGSSKFAKGHRWGYFPSLALAWNIYNEPFMKKADWIDQLKLRVSAGVTGNQEIGDFKSLFYYQSGEYTFLDGSKSVSLFPDNIGNKALQWEKTASYNVGVDFNAFNRRISLTADAYYKVTYDMLSFKKIPRTSGFETAMTNIGDVENKGIEVSITTRNIVPVKKGGFAWESKINYSLNKNKILRLGDNNEDIFVGQSTGNMSNLGTTSILRVGEPVGTFYGCVNDGIWRDAEQIAASGMLNSPKPGDTRFVDQNKDGYINDKDRVVVGYAYPAFTGSLNNTLSYNNFSLDIFIYGSYGNKVFNLNRHYLEGWVQYNKPTYMVDRWTATNSDGIYANKTSKNMQSTPGAASDYVEDASYLRLKSVTLAYIVPTTFIKKLNIDNAKLFITGDNLFVLTKYRGYDPEVNSFGLSNTSLGTDLGAYPKYSTIIFGLSLTF